MQPVRRQPVAGSRCGFTLVELLLVLAVVLVMSGLAVPSMTRWQRGVELNQAAGSLRDELLQARVRAIRELFDVSFSFVPGGRQYRFVTSDSLGAVIDESTGMLPESVRFEEFNTRSASHESWSVPVWLRPDGTATDAVIRLRDSSGDRSTIEIDRLTGSIRSREGAGP